MNIDNLYFCKFVGKLMIYADFCRKYTAMTSCLYGCMYVCWKSSTYSQRSEDMKIWSVNVKVNNADFFACQENCWLCLMLKATLRYQYSASCKKVLLQNHRLCDHLIQTGSYWHYLFQRLVNSNIQNSAILSTFRRTPESFKNCLIAYLIAKNTSNSFCA